MNGIFIAASVLVGYVAALVALGVAVRPARERLYDNGCDLLDDPAWNSRERAQIEKFMETSFSFAVGLLIPVAAVSFFLDVALRRSGPEVPDGMERLDADIRFQRMVIDYALSIAAANPLAVVASIPIVLLGAALDIVISSVPIRVALGQPVRIAANRIASV